VPPDIFAAFRRLLLTGAAGGLVACCAAPEDALRRPAVSDIAELGAAAPGECSAPTWPTAPPYSRC
jgi:hypothetical protein